MRALAIGATVLWIVAGVAVGEDPGAAPPADAVSVRAVALSVIRAPATRQPRTPGYGEGTQVTLLVLRKEGNIVGVDEGNCSVETFVDDRGTILLPKDADPFGPERPVRDGAISPDGKAVRVTVRARTFPAKQATTLRAAGRLAISVATNAALDVHKAVALKQGTKLQSGPLDLEITSVNDEDGRMTVGLRMGGDSASFIGIEFLDEKWEALDASKRVWWVGPDGVPTQVYEIATRVDTATIRVEFWADRKTLMVPFDITTGLGLSDRDKEDESAPGTDAKAAAQASDRAE